MLRQLNQGGYKMTEPPIQTCTGSLLFLLALLQLGCKAELPSLSQQRGAAELSCHHYYTRVGRKVWSVELWKNKKYRRVRNGGWKAFCVFSGDVIVLEESTYLGIASNGKLWLLLSPQNGVQSPLSCFCFRYCRRFLFLKKSVLFFLGEDVFTVLFFGWPWATHCPLA